MNTQSFTEKLIAGLETAARGVDHLKVQFALGKAEARDLFEEIKSDFRKEMDRLKSRLKALQSDEDIVRVLNAFEHLQVQLALGKAETADLFEEQKKELSKRISAIEQQVLGNPKLKELSSEFNFEIERFRIRLELMGLYFKLGRIKAEYNMKEKKAELENNIEKLRANLTEYESKAKDRFQHFKSEMSEAITHIKKAFD